jgi:hypothetical protein
LTATILKNSFSGVVKKQLGNFEDGCRFIT